MSVQIRVFVLVCVVVLIFGMMNMVRNKKLDLKCFSLKIIFCLTFAVSRLSYKVKRLTQECALLEKRLEELENCAAEQKDNASGIADAAEDGENTPTNEKLPTGGDAL